MQPNLDDDDEFTTVAASRDGYDESDVEALFDGALLTTAPVFSDSARRVALVGCTPASATDPCLATFFTTFGLHAFRRPLTNDELQRYLGIVSIVSTQVNYTLWDGVQYAVAGIIQSPNLIYLPEVGEPDTQDKTRFRYTSWEVATRLAYAITGAPPDDTLLGLAAADQLTDLTTVQAQAERLITSAAGRASLVNDFFGEYWALNALDGLGKDTSVFPLWTSTLGAAMGQETQLMMDDAVFANESDFSSLFTRRSTFVNSELANLYGLPAPTADGFNKVQIPDNWERAGALGMASYLSINSKSTRTSPTIRGRFIVQRLLCTSIPPPPANIPPLDDSATSAPMTMRDRLTTQHKNPGCAGCHDLMDPPGLSLEKFDGIGAFRTTDNGLALDVSGTLNGTAYDGEVGLGSTLASDPKLNACLAQQVFRYAAGEKANEPGELLALQNAADASQGKVKALVLGVVTSDLFRYFHPASP